jgi:hypothetical protein
MMTEFFHAAALAEGLSNRRIQITIGLKARGTIVIGTLHDAFGRTIRTETVSVAWSQLDERSLLLRETVWRMNLTMLDAWMESMNVATA